MTVASEIERLQCAKEDIRQAIIDKGVSISTDLTIDDYACCIAEISSGPKYGFIDLLVIGGGGNGGSLSNANDSEQGGGGGGAGGFIECFCYPLNSDTDGCIPVKVGLAQSDSCFGSIISRAGGRGGYGVSNCGCRGGDGASGGGGGVGYNGGGRGNNIYPGQGNNGGTGQRTYCCIGNTSYYGFSGGGGGAGGDGCNHDTPNLTGGAGGIGKCSCISGECLWYSGGGGGIGRRWRSGRMDYGTVGVGGCGGGGDGYCNATYYGGGGGGGGCSGYQGVVILRYHTNGSDGLLPTSNGGCKYTCGDYTIHCFTDTSAVQQFIPIFK